MQGPLNSQQPPQGEYGVLATITRQLERLEDRTRNLATRDDLDALRKDVVARDLLEPQLSLLKSRIDRIDKDQEALGQRQDKMEDEQVSRSDRLWMRLSVAAAVLACIFSLFEFLTHLHITP